MAPEEVVRVFGKSLSEYEREEVLDQRQLIHYVHLNSNLKGVGKYNKGALTCLDEDPDKNVSASGIFNFGFDNDQADYIYEPKDQIQYRYEV